jgi:geranylgeranylglycerol-phosphate geranylgeranyltransferase
MRLKAFFRLTRIEHSLFLALAVLIGEIVVTKDIQVLPTVFGILSVFFIGMGSFAVNDIFDYKIDKLNKRVDRPLVSGKFSLQGARRLTVISFLLGIMFSFLININCIIIGLVFTILSVAYSTPPIRLKHLPLVGNLFIAFSMAVPFIYGNYIVAKEINGAIWILALIAFLTGVGREIIKSVQDVRGDQKYGAKTLPVVIATQKSIIIAIIPIFFAVVLSVIPFLLLSKFQNNWLYLGPIIVTDLILLWSICLSVRLKELEKVRKLTLLALGIGLMGFLLGAL